MGPLAAPKPTAMPLRAVCSQTTCFLISQEPGSSAEAGDEQEEQEKKLSYKPNDKNETLPERISQEIEPLCGVQTAGHSFDEQSEAAGMKKRRASMDPVRLTFDDPSLEMKFKMHLAARNLHTDLGWASCLLVLILSVWTSFSSSLPCMRLFLLSFTWHAASILCRPSWYKRHREMLCSWNSSGMRVLFCLAWMSCLRSPHLDEAVAARVAKYMLVVIPFAHGADYLGFKVRFWPGLLRSVSGLLFLAAGAQAASKVWGWSFSTGMLVYCVPYTLTHGLMTMLTRKWELVARAKFLAGLESITMSVLS
eukprot:jgi/Botrbrau1/11514/Bobra.0198s0011.1